MKNIVNAEVNAACADPAPGRVILLVNPRFYIEEDNKGKDAVGNKLRTDPKNVREFQIPLANMADIYSSDAFGTRTAHGSCRLLLVQLGMLGKEHAVGLAAEIWRTIHGRIAP